jgi:hypothetical protein
MKYLALFLLFLGLQLSVLAQDSTIKVNPEKIKISAQDYANQQVAMADAFRADGKIYVVVAVILVILGGIFVYLFTLDKKIAALEKIAKEK